jgi:hypothetical protein
MKLSELFLNRLLYKDNKQSLETKDSAFLSADSTPEEPAAIPSGGAAQDINTGNVTINGNQLTPGTIPQTVLDVSNWGWGQTCAFSSTDLDTVSWGSGVFTSAGGETYAISAGNTGNMSAKNYIYLDLNVSDTAYQITTTPANAVGIGKVLIAVAQNAAVSATFALSEATQIVGDNIIANTINASKLNVGQLSAISADIGDITAGTITGVTITGGTLQTSVTGKRVVIATNQIKSYDSSNVLRMLLDGSSLGFGDPSGNEIMSIQAETGYVLFKGAVGEDTGLTFLSSGTGVVSFGVDSSVYLTVDAPAIEAGTDFIPDTDSTYDLGTTSKRWSTLYVDNIVGAATGATTALDNLSSVAINTSLVSDTDATDNLGSSSIAWRHLYLGGTGNIYFNNELAFDFSTSTNYVWLGSTGFEYFAPDSSLGSNLGSTSYRWATLYADEIDLTGNIDMNGNDIDEVDVVSGSSGGIDFSISGRVQVSTYFDPADGGTYNLGGSTRYWGDVSYKTLTDRGCLGWYDDGVELQDGTLVSDLEALKNLKKHPTLKTPAGAPRIDYKSMPKHVYVPPMNHQKELLPKDENGDYYEMVEQKVLNPETGKKEKKLVKMKAEEGAETTALIAIMLGAIKELGTKIEAIEKKLKKE